MPAASGSRFADVLADALALPMEDQARLCSVLERLTEHSPAAVASPPSPNADAPEPGQQQLEAWLAQIASEPAWTQLLLLDDAMERVDSEAEASPLKAARTRLLQANPATAVRRAV